jgi:peroxin-2
LGFGVLASSLKTQKTRQNPACRSLLERLAGARLVYAQPVMSRLVSFEYLNRQLVWQELSELLLFLLPLLDLVRTQ